LTVICLHYIRVILFTSNEFPVCLLTSLNFGQFDKLIASKLRSLAACLANVGKGGGG